MDHFGPPVLQEPVQPPRGRRIEDAGPVETIDRPAMLTQALGPHRAAAETADVHFLHVRQMLAEQAKLRRSAAVVERRDDVQDLHVCPSVDLGVTSEESQVTRSLATRHLSLVTSPRIARYGRWRYSSL